MPDTRSLTYDEDCRRCGRLATFLADVHARPPDLLVQAGAAVRRERGAARHRRPGAGHARRQRERPSLHRRLRGHPALRDAASLRLRVQAGRRVAQRRPAPHRLPHHQRGEVPAAGQQADAGGGARTATPTSRPTCARCRRAASCSRSGRIAHDATLRALGAARGRLSVRARRGASAAPATGCSSTAIIAAATTRTRDG